MNFFQIQPIPRRSSGHCFGVNALNASFDEETLLFNVGAEFCSKLMNS